jgi:hypothetical protein
MLFFHTEIMSSYFCLAGAKSREIFGYFDSPQRDSHAVHYTLIKGGEGSLYSCTYTLSP